MVRVKNRHTAPVCGVLPGDVGLVSERDANILRRYLSPVEPPAPPPEPEVSPLATELDPVVSPYGRHVPPESPDVPPSETFEVPEHKPRKRRS